jgi:hypothetical protein
MGPQQAIVAFIPDRFFDERQGKSLTEADRSEHIGAVSSALPMQETKPHCVGFPIAAGNAAECHYSASSSNSSLS